MQITTMSKAEHLQETDVKQMIVEFESGVAKDLDSIRKMLEQLHTEIKSIERMIINENKR